MSNQWTEIHITIPTADLDTAAAIAQMTVPYGIYIEDYSDIITEVPKIAHIDIIDEELLARPRDKAIIHVYISPEENPAEAISFLNERLQASGIIGQVGSNSIEEEDWAFGWKKYYHPMQLGKRLVVCPTWEDYTPTGDQLVLRLDPGMAFGTGTHHTTQLCMRLLEDAVTKDAMVLDMGCGSGILSMAALALGAKHAIGVDIDALAVRIATENLAGAGFTDRFLGICADLVNHSTPEIIPGSYDVIAANIVADTIIILSPAMHIYLKTGGKLIASGIITERLDEVLVALAAANLTVDATYEQEGWAAVVAHK